MYDVVVIGGGPGGYAAAIRASQLGGRVALVEAGDMGGTCVNRGCIPTKVWHEAAAMLRSFRMAEAFGIKSAVEGLNLTDLRARKNGVASDIRMGMEALLANNGIEVIRGRAVLRNPREIDADGKKLETRKTILATGGSLVVPDIPGLEEAAVGTDRLLDMTDAPASVLLCGDGLIEVELASTLSIFGVRIVLATESRRLLPREDQETGQRVSQGLLDLGVELHRKARIESVEASGGGFKVNLSGSDQTSVTVDRVVISGRKPNSARLGLDQVGIRVNDDGSVWVNDRLETSKPEVYAVGDVTGGWMLSHAASSMGVTAAENAMGKSGKYPFHLVPRVAWSFPEMGAVGLSEEEAEEKDLEVNVGDFPYAINGLAMARDEAAGAVKIVSDARYGEILGVHIVGACATELIGEAVLAMSLECTVQELARNIRAHPTYSETIVDASRAALNWALYLPKR
ncbi:MAG: dihydrolipoyl dehydrogenase [Deltaproteobacteria bacterium]|nr:dihydrolipoyl dehydrogenase [Deltaproteobacteria bacterium]